jgi:hypothetical protein
LLIRVSATGTKSFAISYHSKAAQGTGLTFDQYPEVTLADAFRRHIKARAADHYPDRETPHVDHFVVLCGGLVVGGWHRVTRGSSGGGWQWGVFITASSGFVAGATRHRRTNASG